MSDTEKEQDNVSVPSSLVSELENGENTGDGGTMYKYRDFSNVAEEEIAESVVVEKTSV